MKMGNIQLAGHLKEVVLTVMFVVPDKLMALPGRGSFKLAGLL